MGFHEVQFPTTISYRSSGGPSFDTSVVEVDSGAEERTSHWNSARHRYDVAYGIKDFEQLTELINFFHGRRGSAYGFRYKDWLDFTSATNHRDSHTNLDRQIGLGDNVETEFQLVKFYTSGPVTRTRTITKPVASTVLIALDGVGQTEGVDYTVNTTTGLITFSVAPGAAVVITAGYEFDVPVRFGKALPQETMDISIDTFQTGGIGSIPLVEIIDEVQPDEFFYGGSISFSAAAETETGITAGTRCWFVTPTGADAALTLPDPTLFPGGGPWFYIFNLSGAQSLTILNFDLSTLVVLTTNQSAIICLDGDNDTWYAIIGA